MSTRYALMLIGLLMPAPFAVVPAQEGADGEPVDCVRLSRIDRTEIIDETHIVFYMRGGDIFINRLERSCRGLDEDRPFSYTVSGSSLCSTDAITVLERFGVDFRRGASCPLGPFLPADRDFVEMLKGERDLGEQPEVTVTEIEVEP